MKLNNAILLYLMFARPRDVNPVLFSAYRLFAPKKDSFNLTYNYNFRLNKLVFFDDSELRELFPKVSFWHVLRLILEDRRINKILDNSSTSVNQNTIIEIENDFFIWTTDSKFRRLGRVFF
jgi:hypothetical protein